MYLAKNSVGRKKANTDLIKTLKYIKITAAGPNSAWGKKIKGTQKKSIVKPMHKKGRKETCLIFLFEKNMKKNVKNLFCQ